MEDKLINIYLETRKNHTQIVSFVAGGITVLLAAILSASVHNDVKGYMSLGLSLVTFFVFIMHWSAFSEHSLISKELEQHEKVLALLTGKFNQIIILSATCFLTGTVACVYLTFHYLKT